MLYKGNAQNKKNGYLKTEEFHKFEKKYIEENEKYLTKDDFNEFKEAHDNVHKDIGDRLVKVEIILEKVVESLKELKDDVKENYDKGISNMNAAKHFGFKHPPAESFIKNFFMDIGFGRPNKSWWLS